MALFKKKMQDVLEQKEAKLSVLTQRSDDAVQLVRSTMNGLDAIDAEIEQTISEIDEIQTRMSNARAGLEARRNKNQRIKQNFKSLLCEE
jgi:peptidoglycan hydrolase CwlO-like protein